MRIGILSLIILFLLPLHVKAENFSATNIQYLYGSDFKEVAGGDSVSDGRMDTITFEHFGVWDYGSNFFFVDLTSGNFDSGKTSTLYMEYAPNLSLSKLSKSELSWGIFKDIHLSAQINQGDNFRALMAGVGVDLNIPGFKVLSLDIYSRKDDYNKQTFHSTMVWYSSLIWGTRWIFEGFLDYYGVDDGTVLLSHPRILVDASFISPKLSILQAGVEFYIYGNYGTSDDFTTTVPQMMIKWVW